MPEPALAIESGRRAHAVGDWSAALDAFLSARAELATDDLVLAGRCAGLMARIPEALDLAEEAFHRLAAEDRPADAAMTALLLALLLVNRGELAVGVAWMGRARRILEPLPDSPAHGYLAYLDAIVALEFGTPLGTSLERLAQLAADVDDPVLRALDLAAHGFADLSLGEVEGGFVRLEEAMLPVVAGRLPPEWAGDIYCTVIHCCHRLADFRRMSEWTWVTERWCRQFVGEHVFGTICRVHRLELLGASGQWGEVEGRLASESESLLGVNSWVAGAALHQLGEMRRIRGDVDGARDAYDAARRAGVEPQPGESLLLLRLGRTAEAWSGISTALAEPDPMRRMPLLRPGVEIAVAAGRMPAAEGWSRELRASAEKFSSPGFAAWADHCEGMVELGRGRYRLAIERLTAAEAALRRAEQLPQTIQVLEQLAAAHQGLGDGDGAEQHRARAEALRGRLGLPTAPSAAAGPLTGRETEVLECVAEGLSNREVAQRLVISEKTVGRHLANIYLKLDVGSRTAAAAWCHDR